ncbi:tyrosine--tRNA ligase [Rubritalea marina]|uniref:tyrosine--tRNA ligase n=1 Tax=Rubritalea marina TaxID=361055 RepID=UPI00037E3725|nr:tyrosine--tRNA ligase [Rubritalea marina]
MSNALEQLVGGTAKVLSEKELAEKLELGRPLRVKLGVDPTAPDIHLGHTVAIEKLRQFQELGHTAVLIIGDFTATVGDPTGRSAARPPITREEVLSNAETYTTQAFKILDPDKTEVVYNGDWFNKMTYDQVLKLNGRVTMQQMLQREDFKSRLADGKEVRLHEIQYPIMQGWDSVVVKSDVEIGGTDQLFNILVGRDLQKEEGMPQQIVMLMPLLEGLDGVKKMSKSSKNYVGVSEPAPEMVNKLMSISDALMDKYYLMLLGTKRDASMHPRDAKLELARRITARYHDESSAADAVQKWLDRSKGDQGAGATDVTLADFPTELTVLSMASSAFQIGFNLKKSNGELKKQAILPGAIQLNGEKLTDPNAVVTLAVGDVLRLSKKHTVKFC